MFARSYNLKLLNIRMKQLKNDTEIDDFLSIAVESYNYILDSLQPDGLVADGYWYGSEILSSTKYALNAEDIYISTNEHDGYGVPIGQKKKSNELFYNLLNISNNYTNTPGHSNMYFSKISDNLEIIRSSGTKVVNLYNTTYRSRNLNSHYSNTLRKSIVGRKIQRPEVKDIKKLKADNIFFFDKKKKIFPNLISFFYSHAMLVNYSENKYSKSRAIIAESIIRRYGVEDINNILSLTPKNQKTKKLKCLVLGGRDTYYMSKSKLISLLTSKMDVGEVIFSKDKDVSISDVQDVDFYVCTDINTPKDIILSSDLDTKSGAVRSVSEIVKADSSLRTQNLDSNKNINLELFSYLSHSRKLPNAPIIFDTQISEWDFNNTVSYTSTTAYDTTKIFSVIENATKDLLETAIVILSNIDLKKVSPSFKTELFFVIIKRLKQQDSLNRQDEFLKKVLKHLPRLLHSRHISFLNIASLQLARSGFFKFKNSHLLENVEKDIHQSTEFSSEFEYRGYGADIEYVMLDKEDYKLKSTLNNFNSTFLVAGDLNINGYLQISQELDVSGDVDSGIIIDDVLIYNNKYSGTYDITGSSVQTHIGMNINNRHNNGVSVKLHITLESYPHDGVVGVKFCKIKMFIPNFTYNNDTLRSYRSIDIDLDPGKIESLKSKLQDTENKDHVLIIASIDSINKRIREVIKSINDKKTLSEIIYSDDVNENSRLLSEELLIKNNSITSNISIIFKTLLENITSQELFNKFYIT